MRNGLYFLSTLNDSDIDWLVAAGSRREVAAGVNLIDEGRPIDSVFLVIDGVFDVRSALLGGRSIRQLMAGEVLGEMSFVDSAPPSATVQAVEPSFVLAIPRRRLNTKLSEDLGFAARFYRALSMLLADRLRLTVAAFADRPARDVDGELSAEAMDDVGMASARFDWIRQRLRSA